MLRFDSDIVELSFCLTNIFVTESIGEGNKFLEDTCFMDKCIFTDVVEVYVEDTFVSCLKCLRH